MGARRRTKESPPFRSVWFRCEYVVAGEEIRVRPGAQPARYDPWAAYELARSTPKGGKVAPYTDLQRLLLEIDRGFVDANAAIEVWCTRYGLLGVGEPQPLGRLGISSATMVEAAWDDLPALATPGVPLPSKEQIAGFLDALQADPSLSEDIDRFIPPSRAADVANFDLLGRMRLAVAEPVSAFLDAGRRLATVVEALHGIQKSPRSAHEYRNAIADFDSILRGSVHEGAEIEGRYPRPRWIFDTLFGCLAKMIFTDALPGKRRWRRCDNCTVIFAALENYGQRHCSEACREAWKRRDK